VVSSSLVKERHPVSLQKKSVEHFSRLSLVTSRYFRSHRLEGNVFIMHYPVINNHGVGELIDQFRQVYLTPKKKNMNKHPVMF
jgi:hypothetical protein